ncbi:MAG TPA: hypothetical protein VJS68_00120, partial [Thermoplasmata archaeon]|nr:hypothetical protein [Thermoplasmata archaeon]
GGIFQRNLADLKSKVPGAPSLQGPTWFDRGAGSLDGDALGRAAASKGVLVCPGSFFGDASGVRICLTRRTFPEDLDAYLKVRSRFVRRGGEPTSNLSR